MGRRTFENLRGYWPEQSVDATGIADYVNQVQKYVVSSTMTEPKHSTEPLARRLGATKGSFYWHFADRTALIAATLELWEQRETTEVIERIQDIDDPRERLTALGRGAYAGAAQGNAHATVLAAASDPRVGPVLERVTRARLGFLERLYSDLGVPADRHARLAYALYLGIGELRRADPDSDPDGPELDAYLNLAVDSMIPPTVSANNAGG